WAGSISKGLLLLRRFRGRAGGTGSAPGRQSSGGQATHQRPVRFEKVELLHSGGWHPFHGAEAAVHRLPFESEHAEEVELHARPVRVGVAYGLDPLETLTGHQDV